MEPSLAQFTFHHLGLAVRDDAAALLWLHALGYQCGEPLVDSQQKVRLRLCTSSLRPTVEIVSPIEGMSSPVEGIVNKYNEMIYHTCYEVDDSATALDLMKAAGLRVTTLTKRTPAPLFGGRYVSFYRVPGVGIIELLERAA